MTHFGSTIIEVVGVGLFEGACKVIWEKYIFEARKC